MENSQARKNLSSTGRLIRWAGTLVSSGLFIWLLAHQNWSETWRSLSHTPLWLVPLVFLLYFSAIMINTLRWTTLLRAQRIGIPFLDLLRIFITGAFASNFLPSTIGGDTVRIVSLTRYQVSWTLSVASVVVDRLLNVLAMFTILPFSYGVFGSPAATLVEPSTLKDLLKDSSIASWSPLLLGSVRVSGSWIAKWRVRLSDWFGRLWEILQKWLQTPRSLVIAFTFSWLSSFVVFVAVWILARGLDISISLIQVMGAMALTYLVSLLPISINGYGIREIAVTALYMQIGATLEQASTLAVVTRFVLLIETLPGALWLSSSVTSQADVEKLL
jgi:uncharacterized membrane protein YbhN (UPF0104 family)